jgi:hypothetical protein
MCRHSAEMEMTPGNYSPTGPRCMLTQMDGIRAGRCLDGHSSNIEPGGLVRVFPCVKRWPQFVSFGNGDLAPKGSMHTNVPQHIVDRIRESHPEDPTQEAYLCLGVLRRGDNDEEHLYKAEAETNKDANTEEAEVDREYGEDDYDENGVLKLDHFRGDKIVATRCSNFGAVIEWLFVPFIVEDEEATDGDDTNSAPETTAESNSDHFAQNAPQPTCAADSCSDADEVSTSVQDE